MIMSKQGLQLNMDFKPWGKAWYFSHSHNYICGRIEHFNLWTEKFTQTDLTWNQTWCCLHENPVLMSDHQIPTFQYTVPPNVFQKLVFQQYLKYLCIRTVNKATKITSLILNKFQTMIFLNEDGQYRQHCKMYIPWCSTQTLPVFFTFKMSHSFPGHL